MNRFFLVRTKKKNSVPKKIILGFVPFSYKNLAKSCEIQEFPRKSVPTGVKIQGFWDVPGTKSWELHFVKVAGIIFFGTYQKKAVHVSRCVRPQFELNGAAGQLHISIATVAFRWWRPPASVGVHRCMGPRPVSMVVPRLPPWRSTPEDTSEAYKIHSTLDVHATWKAARPAPTVLWQPILRGSRRQAPPCTYRKPMTHQKHTEFIPVLTSMPLGRRPVPPPPYFGSPCCVGAADRLHRAHTESQFQRGCSSRPAAVH